MAQLPFPAGSQNGPKTEVLFCFLLKKKVLDWASCAFQVDIYKTLLLNTIRTIVGTWWWRFESTLIRKSVVKLVYSSSQVEGRMNQ